MKKFLSILMILALALSMGTLAFADAEAPVTYDITVTGGTGHTYNVYQIFTGDFSSTTVDEETQEILANVAFGQNYAVAENETIKTALAALEGKSGVEAAAYLQGKLNAEAAFAVLNADNSYTTKAVGGYYLIVDVTEKLPEGETPSAYIVQVVGDTTIASKHDTAPIVEKKVDDKNDTTGAEDDIIWHDSADHDIGDIIDFKLETTIPASIDLFREYKEAYPFTFHDTEEKGLDFQGIVSIEIVNGETVTPITSGYELKENTEDGCTFEVVFTDLTAYEAAVGGAKLVVNYRSQLTEDAILGSQGNVNEVYGEFRNIHHPETPAYTPKDTVIVFTYKVDVSKVRPDGTDENGDPVFAPLAGAEFTLEKKVLKTPATEGTEAVYEWKAIDVVKTQAGDQFSFIGLDDGDYRLTETVTPAGYNNIDPIEFTVTAEHDIEWTIQERDDVLTSLTGNVATGELTFTADKTVGSLSADVVNQKGVELPETGGNGTTMFYFFGGCLVLGAIVLLITKKRMKNAEN